MRPAGRALASGRIRAARHFRGSGLRTKHSRARPLRQVLRWHAPTLKVLHVLAPVCVVMAAADEFDPYKD